MDRKFSRVNLRALLGDVTCESLGYPGTLTVLLTNFAKLLSTPNAFVDAPSKFDVWELAIRPCTMKRFPSGSCKALSKMYSSREGLLDITNPFCTFTELLGCLDDGGKGTTAPMSARSLINVISAFIRDYHAFDAELVEQAAEGVMLGCIHDFFQLAYEPMRAGRDPECVMSRYFVQPGCPHVAGLATLQDRLLQDANRKNNENVSLDLIPGAALARARAGAGTAAGSSSSSAINLANDTSDARALIDSRKFEREKHENDKAAEEEAARKAEVAAEIALRDAAFRKRNLRDQAKLRQWYPDHCTHHLFYHHVLQRPPSAGCTFAKPGQDFCQPGTRPLWHSCPDDLAECDLEAFQE